MTAAWEPAPFRIAFDTARDPYTARNALGVTGTGAVSSATPPLSITSGVISINLTGYVTASGTPAANDLAQWVSATAIKGLPIATHRTNPVFTGDVTVQGGVGQILFTNASNATRWAVLAVNTPLESGGNAGSDYSVYRYSDAGSYLGSSFLIKRSSGVISFGNLAASGGYFGPGNADVAMGCSNAQIGIATKQTVAGVGNYAHYFFSSTAGTSGYILINDTTVTYSTTSDARLKINDTPFTRGREIIEQLPIVEFEWKETGVSDVGVIAQQVRDVYPGAVSEGVGEPGDDGFVPWGVDYGKYVPVLIQSLQEAFREIDILKTQLKELRDAK